MQSVFVAVPIHDGKIYAECVAGMMQMQTAFAGRCAFETLKGSFLPISRDVLTMKFLDSGATHMLCLDSDIGFTVQNVNDLLECNVDFVSGVYCKKDAKREIPAKLAGNFENGMLEANSVPAGFILLTRACVERMVGAYRNLEYQTVHGNTWALWSPIFQISKTYTGEDVAFCNRWKSIGGKIWIRPDVVLRHYGDHCYLPDTDENGTLRFES